MGISAVHQYHSTLRGIILFGTGRACPHAPAEPTHMHLQSLPTCTCRAYPPAPAEPTHLHLQSLPTCTMVSISISDSSEASPVFSLRSRVIPSSAPSIKYGWLQHFRSSIIVFIRLGVFAVVPPCNGSLYRNWTLNTSNGHLPVAVNRNARDLEE